MRRTTTIRSVRQRRGCGVTFPATQACCAGSLSQALAGRGGTFQPSPPFRGGPLERRDALGRGHVVDALPVRRHEGVEIDQRPEAPGRAVGGAGHDHAAIAVAAQHDVVQFFPFEQVGDIQDMGVQAGLGRQQMRTVGEAGQRRRKYPMAGRLQPACNLPPAPAAVPGAMHQNESSSSAGLSPRWRRRPPDRR